MKDADTGVSRGFGFVSFDSFESADASMAAMNGQFLCNAPISVSYAYKKDTKGERHGDAAERLIADNLRNTVVKNAPTEPMGGHVGGMGGMGGGAHAPPPMMHNNVTGGGMQPPSGFMNKGGMQPPPFGMNGGGKGGAAPPAFPNKGGGYGHMPASMKGNMV